MSDYLNNMVARALNSASLIQPRLPSLFEPPSLAAEWLPSALPPKTETADDESSTRGTSFDASPRTQPSVRKFPGDTSPPPLMPTPDSWRRQPERSDAGPAAERPLEPQQAEHGATIPLPPQTVGRRHAATSPTGGETVPQSSPETPVSIPSIAALKARMVLPKGGGERGGEPAESTSTPATQSAAPARVAAPPPEKILIKPATRAVNEPMIVQEQPPKIRITIGRVEVRAIMPPQSPSSSPRPVRPQARLSLDDYLKQREESQR